MIRKIGKYISGILTLALVVSALGVVASTPLFGNRALIVRSGSMEPAISVGDVVVSRPADAYSIDDVISFRAGPQEQLVITHRIVEVVENGFRTQGDANAAPDEFVVNASQVLGKQLIVMPYIGLMLAFAKTKLGFMLLVLLPLLVVVSSEVRVIIKEWRKLRSKFVVPLATWLRTHSSFEPKTSQRQAPLHIAVDGISRRLALVILAGALMSIGSSLAVYSDTGQSTGNVFTASADFSPEETISPSDTPTPEPNIANHIVISEAQIEGAGGTQPARQDFVELYNPTEVGVDLTGWKLRKVNSNGNESSLVAIPGGTIPAHGFFLWANSENSFAGNIGADVSNTENISPDFSIALKKPDNTMVDQVRWGAGSSTPEPQYGEGSVASTPSNGGSIERKAVSTSTAASMLSADAARGNGFDSGNNANDFVLRSASQPQNSSNTSETL